MPIVQINMGDDAVQPENNLPLNSDTDSLYDKELSRGFAGYRKIQDYSKRHRKMLGDAGINYIANQQEADRSDYIIESAERDNIKKMTNDQIFSGMNIDTAVDSPDVDSNDPNDPANYLRGVYTDPITPVIYSGAQSMASFTGESARGVVKFALNPVRRVNELLEPIGVKLPEYSGPEVNIEENGQTKKVYFSDIVNAMYDKLGKPTKLEEGIATDRQNAINQMVNENDWSNAYSNVILNTSTDISTFLLAMIAATGSKFEKGTDAWKWGKETINAIKEGGKFAAFEAIRNPAEGAEYRKVIGMAVAFAFIPFLGKSAGKGLEMATKGKSGGKAFQAVTAMLASLGVQIGDGEVKDAIMKGIESAEAQGKDDYVKYAVLNAVPLLENDVAMGLMTRSAKNKNNAEAILKNEEKIARPVEKPIEQEVQPVKESVIEPTKGGEDANAQVPAKPQTQGISPKEQVDTELQPAVGVGTEKAQENVAAKPTAEPVIPKRPIADEPYEPSPMELIDRINQFPDKFNGIFDRIVSYIDGNERYKAGKRQALVSDLLDASEYLPTKIKDKVYKLMKMPVDESAMMPDSMMAEQFAGEKSPTFEFTANDLMDASVVTLKGIESLKRQYLVSKNRELNRNKADIIKEQLQNMRDVASAKINLVSMIDEVMGDNEYAQTKMGKMAKKVLKTSEDFGKRVEEIQKWADWGARKTAVDSLKDNISLAGRKGDKYFGEFAEAVKPIVADIDMRSKEKVDLYEAETGEYKGKKVVPLNKPVAGLEPLLKVFEGEGAEKIMEVGIDIDAVSEKVKNISGLKDKPFSQWKANEVQDLSDLLGVIHATDMKLKKGARADFTNEMAFRMAQATIDADARNSYKGANNFTEYKSHTAKDWTLGVQDNFDTELMGTFGKDSPTYQWLSRQLYDMPNKHVKNVNFLMNKFVAALRDNGFTDSDLSKIPNLSYRFTGIMPRFLGTKLRKFKLSEGREMELTPAEAVTLRLLARSPDSREFLLKGEQGVSSDNVAFETLRNKPENKLTPEEMDYLLSDEFYKSSGTGREKTYQALENAIWDFNNNTLKKFGNDASNRIEGYSRFNEDNHVHIERVADYTKSKQEVADIMSAGWKPNLSLPESAGRFKTRQKGANARMRLYDPFADIEQSIGQFARYDAYGEGLHAIRKVLTAPSVVDSVRKNMGDDAWQRIKKHMNRISGETSTSGAIPFLSWNGISGNITKSLVQWSPTALAVQPSAIFTAIPEVGAENMITGMKNYMFDPEFKRLYNEVNKTSGLVQERVQGHLIGTEIGRLGKSVAMQETLTGKKTWQTHEGIAMRFMDGTSVNAALIGALQKSLVKRGMSAKDFYEMDAKERDTIAGDMGYEAWQSLINGGQALQNTEAQSLWQGSKNPLMKVLGAFHSPIDQIVSRQHRNWLEYAQSERTASDFRNFTYNSIMTYLAPAIFAGITRSAIGSLKADSDKREKLQEKDKNVPFTDIKINGNEQRVIINTLGEIVGQQYIVGDAVKGVLNMYVYGRGFGGGANSPLLDSVSDVSTFAYDLSNAVVTDAGWNDLTDEQKDAKAKKLGLQFARGIGKATGHSIQGWIDWMKVARGTAEETGMKEIE